MYDSLISGPHLASECHRRLPAGHAYQHYSESYSPTPPANRGEDAYPCSPDSNSTARAADPNGSKLIFGNRSRSPKSDWQPAKARMGRPYSVFGAERQKIPTACCTNSPASRMITRSWKIRPILPGRISSSSKLRPSPVRPGYPGEKSRSIVHRPNPQYNTIGRGTGCIVFRR